MKKLLLTALLAVPLASFADVNNSGGTVDANVNPETQSTAEPESTSEPESIVVTATRTAMSADDTLAAVSVVTRAQIEQIQPADLLELLALTPGVDISRNGGRGAVSSLFLRGTNNGHVLVLLDGVRIGSSTLGTVSLQNVDPAQVERVEIVRGPRSSLYGSEALGGVIQIFTRKPEGEFKPVVTLGYGSDNTVDTSMAISGKWDATSVGLTVSHLSTHGIDSQVYDGNTDSDKDSYRNTSANLKVEHSFINGAVLAFNYSHSNGENEFDQGNGFSSDPDAAPYAKFTVEAVNASYTLPVTTSWLSILSIGQSEDENQSRDDNLIRFDEFVTNRDQASWQNDIQLNDNYLLTLGVDYNRDEVAGTQSYSQDSRSNRALFGQLQGELAGMIDLVAGYRRDKNQQFGYETTYNIALGFDFSENHRLIVSRGTAFKAPTFNDLYWPASPWSSGNENLLPEESDNVEIEVRGDYDSFKWALTAYQNDIDNLINWAETSPWFWQPSNVNSAKIRGSEFSISTTVANWNFNTVASYVNPEDADTDKLLARRAQKSLSLRLDRQFGKVFVGVTWKTQSHRYDDVANSIRLSGYNTVAFNIGYKVNPKLYARLKIDNVFGKDYQLSNDYNTEGAKGMLSLTYSM